jgi:hypothetical protein
VAEDQPDSMLNSNSSRVHMAWPQSRLLQPTTGAVRLRMAWVILMCVCNC